MRWIGGKLRKTRLGRTLGTVWVCTSCPDPEIVSFTEEECPSCGNARDESEPLFLPTHPTVLDVAGEDGLYPCGNCGRIFKGTHRSCPGCGQAKDENTRIQPRKGIVASAVPRTVQAAVDIRNRAVKARKEQKRKIALAGQSANRRIQKEMTPLNHDTDVSIQIAREFRSQAMSKLTKVGVALGGIALLALFIIFFVMTHDEKARVAGFDWRYEIGTEWKTKLSGSGWGLNNIPRTAFNKACETRERTIRDGYWDKVETDEEYVCAYDENSDGSLTEVFCFKTKDVWVEPETKMDEWCTYDYHEWLAGKSLVAWAENREPHWPDDSIIRTNDHVRESSRSKRHRVWFAVTDPETGEDRIYKHRVPYEDWMEFLDDERFTIAVTLSGRVSSYEHPEAINE